VCALFSLQAAKRYECHIAMHVRLFAGTKPGLKSASFNSAAKKFLKQEGNPKKESGPKKECKRVVRYVRRPQPPLQNASVLNIRHHTLSLQLPQMLRKHTGSSTRHSSPSSKTCTCISSLSVDLQATCCVYVQCPAPLCAHSASMELENRRSGDGGQGEIVQKGHGRWVQNNKYMPGGQQAKKIWLPASEYLCVQSVAVLEVFCHRS